MGQQTNGIYEFGSFRLDAQERLLQREGESVSLTPKAFDLLLALIERHGQLVEKEELFQTVWPDTIVEESNLSSNIALIRKALGDGAQGEYFIETVPKHGYRFVAEVRQIGAAQAAGLGVAPVGNPSRTTTRRKAIIWGAIALFVSVAAAVSYFSRRPVLTDKDTILLADFVNKTGEEVFDGTLREALAIQLSQSPFLNIFSTEQVREGLRYMGRAPEDRLTQTVARELCQRYGLKAFLTGSIASLGHNYLLTLEAVNSQTGEVLAGELAEAENKEQVLKTLDRVTTQLRRKLGESLASIQKFDAPLEQVTTSSLMALKAYSLGTETLRRSQGPGNDEALLYLKRAIELDPNFGQAYSTISTLYRNRGQQELASEYAQKAFELRDRVSEREKLAILLEYYSDVTGELDKQIETALVSKRNYLRDYSPPNSLAMRYSAMGQWESVVAEAREAISRDLQARPPYFLLGNALISLNRFAEAREVYERALQQKPDFEPYHSFLFRIAFVQGDMAEMKRQLDWMSGKPNEYTALVLQAETAAFAGQLRQAQECSRRALELAARRNLKEQTAGIEFWLVKCETAFGSCRHPSAETFDIQTLKHDHRLYLVIAASTQALCGDVKEAESLANELAARNPQFTLMNTLVLPTIRADIELRRGNPDQVIRLLQPALRFEGGDGGFRGGDLACRVIYQRGQAYLRQRSGAEAAAEFQKILNHRGWCPTSYFYPLACLGLARAATLTGDTAKARKAYQELLTLWKEADPDLPLLIVAKQEYEKLK